MIVKNKSGKLFVLSAPSGAGKTTIVNAVLSKLKCNYNIDRVITYTSKLPRLGEIRGIDYNFISKEEFEVKINEGFFLEWSAVYGNYYGFPKYIINEFKQSKSYIVILDRAGAWEIKKKIKDTVLIWIDIPNISILENRLLKRNSDSPDQIKKRLELAHIEIEQEKNNPLFDYKFPNDDLNETINVIERFIIAELGK